MDIVKAFIDNEATASINIKGTTDDPLFQASQIGKLLGITCINSTIRDFDEDEKVMHTMGTLGGQQECTFLTEVGLYRLLGMSRKPIARKFQKWVANVIKEIRIKGKYELEGKLKEVVQKSIIEKEEFNHKTLIDKWKKVSGVYIGRVRYVDDDKLLIKIGSSINLKKRSKDLKKHFGSFVLLDFFEANNHISFEKSIHNDIRINSYSYKFMVNNHTSEETYIIPRDFYIELISIIKKKQKDYQGMSEKYVYKLEKQKQEIELIEKQKEIELIKLQNIQIQNNLPITVVKEVPIEPVNNKQRNISKGYKIQKYTPDGQLVCTYNGLVVAVRQEKNGSESGIRKAIHRNSLYKDHRWMFLERNLPDDTIQDIGETTKIVKQNLELIAMLDIKKEKIMQVFPDQISAAHARNLVSTCGIYNSIKKGRVCSGHYFCHYSKCSDELKAEYLLTNKLPERKKRHNSITVKKLHPITREVLEVFQSYTDITKKYQITMDKIKQVIENDDVYKNFKWSY
jgi:prophage antirepressor-like protein